MEITLKVEKSGSGRMTLCDITNGNASGAKKDINEVGLLGNSDKADFYERVAFYIAKLSMEGYKVNFELPSH